MELDYHAFYMHVCSIKILIHDGIWSHWELYQKY